MSLCLLHMFGVVIYRNCRCSRAKHLIHSWIYLRLQERGGMSSFEHEALTLKYKLDNEFELVFVVAYQKILQLSYVDKFLNEIQMEFRNKYKDDLQVGKISRNFTDFEATFQRILKETEAASREEAKAPK
ncbi:hypothetical protein CAPTEDRAFT_206153 [Capitella teleta]|uniref:Signal recognition particle receptor alpha subunit N-terminal domain-containing protein n=1 Tax=Capitella teleta TaxID=283909 RepID=R7TTM1_CAPTE|nr:hypothetical protein CAPTEDRAFT_206153 [Capitella teleta]|eukprot:ELT96962.1 hypothetical protein CAPTEDRAFT_206153 [Capitella teleta]